VLVGPLAHQHYDELIVGECYIDLTMRLRHKLRGRGFGSFPVPQINPILDHLFLARYAMPAVPSQQP